MRSVFFVHASANLSTKVTLALVPQLPHVIFLAAAVATDATAAAATAAVFAAAAVAAAATAADVFTVGAAATTAADVFTVAATAGTDLINRGWCAFNLGHRAEVL